VDNFRDVYDALAAAEAARTVQDSTSLAEAVGRLIGDRETRARMADDALACIGRLTGALERTLDAMQLYLARLDEKHDAAPSP
jgi:3-deoxy-D-manno-octulosonic-acid transferase